jgi:transposase
MTKQDTCSGRKTGQPFREENKAGLELVFLPPYSPELNLVEGLWKRLKAEVINNDAVYHTAAKFIKWIESAKKGRPQNR